MKVTTSAMTVAEYCEQMKSKKIVINRDYQRSNKVWPPAARSFLLDTILLQYPMPKISLHLKTDLKSRETIREIVDGQQRSDALFAFWNDELSLSTKGPYLGQRYSMLEEEDKQKFLDYQLSVDLFVGATDEDIREVFRRINSYTVPLNPQERRHAIHQGEFKWFIIEITRRYSQVLKEIGSFSESQLSRMQDATFFSEFAYALLKGIGSASDARLNKLYENKNDSFPESRDISTRIDEVFTQVIAWPDIHKTVLSKPYNLYSLGLAITHQLRSSPLLESLYQSSHLKGFDSNITLSNLGTLSAAIDEPSNFPALADFVKACSEGTNRINQRQTRFKFFCAALEPKLL